MKAVLSTEGFKTLGSSVEAPESRRNLPPIKFCYRVVGYKDDERVAVGVCLRADKTRWSVEQWVDLVEKSFIDSLSLDVRA